MKTSTTFSGALALAALALSPVPPALAGTLTVTSDAAFGGGSGLEAAPGSACSSPETVELDSQFVIGDVTACSFIRATDTTVAGNVDFTAGIRVSLADGFQVATGADFSVRIDNTLTRLAFVTDRSPAGESTYKAAFRLRMDELNFPLLGSAFVVHLAGFSNNGIRHFEVRLRHHLLMNEDRLLLAAREDDGTVVVTQFGGPHARTAAWPKAFSGPNDGWICRLRVVG